MPNPKHRHSKARRDRRRANDHLELPAQSTCPNCFQAKLPHRVCPHCGMYEGRQVLQVEEIS